MGAAGSVRYHAACNNSANLNPQALVEMSDAAAHMVLTFAQTTLAVNGTDQAWGSAAAKMTFRSPRAIRRLYVSP
jgi:hypothetical protein